ncbi:MAG: acyl-CoA dehydrogenase family protein [Deltaproteobacteria bacterium]|nr:acyl-CoA dehydrogenase family protein [Deltaproteobacteria bacterium]
MDMSYTPEQIAFRDEVRAWIAKALPEHLRCKAENGGHFELEEILEWHKILAAKGWAAPHWPQEVGGTGWDVAQRHIFGEELVRANAPTLSPFGLTMVGPLIIQFGTDEQKKRFLPKILSGDEIWCQGYSEPNAGSDLASLQLRADKEGDDYILNGQKTWTTYAQHADWIFVLARTSPTAKPQEGISFLLADIRNTPGIEVKPFLTTGGTPAFSETWFDNARIPQANRVGPENKGWTMAKALLGHERTSIGGVADSARWLGVIRRIARDARMGGKPLMEDAAFRRRLAKIEIRYRTVGMANMRTLAAAQLGHAPGPESSILKIVGTELQQEATELAMDALGHNALGWFDSPTDAMPEYQLWLASNFNYLRAATIYGGSNEIQKNIISKMILGLPQA